MKVMHIANWYPTTEDPTSANFVRRHYECARSVSDSDLVHLQVKSGPFKFVCDLSPQQSEKRLRLDVPTERSMIIELLSFCLLIYLRLVLGLRGEKYDLWVFHIAYPLLIFPRAVKALVGSPIAILEHWTAYRRHFNLARESRGHRRIGGIFHRDIPVIAVSESLIQDIRDFSGDQRFPSYVVPNIVNEAIFFPLRSDEKRSEIDLFLLARWSSDNKKLMVVVEAFDRIAEDYPQLRLRIGGSGEQLDELERYCSDKPDLRNKISLLGSIYEPEVVAAEMRRSQAFLHPTDFETFSIVCVEALFCGTPVLASNTQPIPTYVDQNNGLIVTENSVDCWQQALVGFLATRNQYDSEKIHQNIHARFGMAQTEVQMRSIFDSIVNAAKG